MGTEQWVTILSQLGVAGAALLVIIYVIVPMFIAKAAELVNAINSGTTATDRNTAAVASLAERVARLEGIFDHDERPRRDSTNPGGNDSDAHRFRERR